MTRFPIPRGAAVLSVLLMAAALGACNRRDEGQTTGQKVDAAIAKADEKVDAAKAEASRAAEDAKASAGQAMTEAKNATTEAVHTAATAVTDTTITATVKHRLSGDAELKAAELGVETREGRVSLRGTAPDDAARERATQLAAGVKGVVAVDNQAIVLR